MDRRTSVVGYAQRASKRLSSSIYAAAGAGVRMVSVDPEFDPEYHEDQPAPTRPAKTSSGKYRVSSLDARGSTSWTMFAEADNTENDGVVRNPQQDVVQKDPFSDVYEFGPGDKGDNEDNENPFTDPMPEQNTVPAPAVTPVAEEPYHVFAKSQKWVLIAIIGVAGLFSGLSSNIYFPALDQIATQLNVNLAAVSLTITSYLIIQGISPVIWGSFSDTLGRRPIYIASFTVYIIANIALSFSPNFAVLLIFRGLQAAGSASTVSIGNGVIQDISPPSERGAFISFYQAIRNFSIAVGPVLGGLLANFLGFRSIFVFLLILSTLVIFMIILLLPETLRSIAGNGSLRLSGIHQPLIQKITKEPEYMQDPDPDAPRRKVTLQTFTDPLRLLAERDILSSLVFGGVVYTIWSMVTSSTTSLFKSTFGLDELQIGLCFLPNGLGTIVGSTIVGKLMTRDYVAAEVAYKMEHDLPLSYKLPPKNVPVDFPIEHARLRRLPWITLLFVISTAGYGFSLATTMTSKPGWIALPLFLQFIIAGTSNAVFALNQTLVSDLCPGKGASSTAINNLVRCGLGAVGVAFVEQMIAAVGPSSAFLGLALVTIICTPLAIINWFYGMEWRADRVERKARVEEMKKVDQKA